MMVLIPGRLAVCTHVECCCFANKSPFLAAGNWRKVWGYSPRSLRKNCLVCLRSEFIFGVQRHDIDIITVLHASVCSLTHDLQFWHFLGSSWYHHPPRSGWLFVPEHLSDIVVDVTTEGVSIFPLKEQHNYVIDLVLLFSDVTKFVLDECNPKTL